MTKSEFVDKVSPRAGSTASARPRTPSKPSSTAIQDVLRSGGEAFNLTGFGKFHVAQRGARQGRAPRARVRRSQIAASRVPRFSAGAQVSSRQSTGCSPAPFGKRLAARVEERASQLVLGLDPDPARLWPVGCRGRSRRPGVRPRARRGGASVAVAALRALIEPRERPASPSSRSSPAWSGSARPGGGARETSSRP